MKHSLLVDMLALAWVQREKALGFKGKAADKAALEYVVGAHVGARLHKHDAFNGLVMLVSIRGAFELRRIAAKADPQAVSLHAIMFKDAP